MKKKYLQRMERARDDSLHDTELHYPHPFWRSHQCILFLLTLLTLRIITLNQVSPSKTEYQKHGLGNCIEHAQRCNVTVASLVCVDVVLEEAAQHSDRAACLTTANEIGARDERRDVACGGGPGNLGLRRFEQGVGDELAQEEVRKGGIARCKPKEEKLRVARLEGAEDRTGENGEKRMKLCQLQLVTIFLLSRQRRSRAWGGGKGGCGG
jgi:hypothetical protein